MANYLNHENQQLVFLLSAIKGGADAELKNKNCPIEVANYLHTISEAADAAVDSLFVGIDRKEVEVLVKRAQQLKYGVFTKDAYVRKVKTEIAMDELNVLTDEQLTVLCEACMASCAICDNTGDDVDECKTRMILLESKIQPLEKHGECPYRVLPKELRGE